MKNEPTVLQMLAVILGITFIVVFPVFLIDIVSNKNNITTKQPMTIDTTIIITNGVADTTYTYYK